MEINDIINKILQIHPDFDTTLLRLAFNIATRKHEGQVRVSGSPYLTHALEVAFILADMQLDVVTIAAGLLHDVVEDTNVTIDEIKENLGEEIALLVEGVTKISAIQFKSLEQRQVANLRKMFLAMAKDIRVVLIKLADRLHNMRTLEFLSSEKKERISKETLEIYAPLANRLGIGKIKNELEDLCFKYLYPEDFEFINKSIEEKFHAREQHIEQIKNNLEIYFKSLNIKVAISGRPKHLYSIYRKMKKQNKKLEQVYDLIAVRIICETDKDCYAILGAVHAKWPPMPGRFKDYIATPKLNMYQSLHTTIISPYGEPIEIQIRTYEMNHIAEEGIAAHWCYKEDEKADEKLIDNIRWLRHIIEWQNELKNPHEFLDTLKMDLFKNEVYVFTPKGMVKTLPDGSTPIDFAYAIHTDIGNKCTGAKVNGKIVPLKYKLKNGDIIEILTGEKHQPKRDWINFAITSRAKSKIRQWIKQQEYQEAVATGEKILINEIIKDIKQFNLDIPLEIKIKEMKNFLPELGFDSQEELFANISYHKGILHQLLTKLFPEHRHEHEKSPQVIKQVPGQTQHQIVIDGITEDIMIKLARCCTPVPYDEIVGFVTRGRGVTIHRVNCSNLQILQNEKTRIIKADWSKKTQGCFNVAIKVKAYDRINLLKDILATIAETKTIINSASAAAVENKMAVCNFLLEIADINQLHDIINKIEKIESVVKVNREDRV